MPTFAFASSFLPSQFPSSSRPRSTCRCEELSNVTVTCSVRRTHNSNAPANAANPILPLLATALAALSVLLGAPPSANADQLGLRERPVEKPRTLSSTSRTRRSSRSSRGATALLINPDAPFEPPKPPSESNSPFLIAPEHNSSSRNGSLLLLEPSAPASEHDPLPDLTMEAPLPAPAPSRSHSALSQAANALPDWPVPRVQRPIYSPSRLFPLRARVRPATLGLVGFGAFTSGSVFLRSLSEKNDVERADGTVEKPTGLCSVVCVQIPFCVPDRERLLAGLTRLADTARLMSAEGMAAAARDAAALLLEEGGLLEDSRKFAPYMDVCLADDLMAAERRFSGHVEIESQRIERLSGKIVEYDVSPQAKLGQYGVVTLVIATAVGVDLKCYDERTTVIKRLRTALDAVCRLEGGDVAGMELRWIPENSEARSLTRAQLADAFPCLRVA